MKDPQRRRFFRAYETAFQLLPALPRMWAAKIRTERLMRWPGFLLAIIGKSAELASSLRSGNPDLRLFAKQYFYQSAKISNRRWDIPTEPATYVPKKSSLGVAWDASRAVAAQAFGLPTAKPTVLYLDVTARCNLSCAYCGVRDYGQMRQGVPELTREEWTNVIEQAGAIGVRVVSFGGGEPLVRDDFIDLIAAATRVGLRTHVNTNGTLLSAAVAARLGEAGLQAASISLDSHVPAHHEQLRGAGSFAGAVDAVRRLRRFSPRTTICLNCTVGLRNVDDMAGMLDLARDLRADTVKFTPLDNNLVHQQKPREDFTDLVLTERDVERIDRAVRRIAGGWRIDPLVGNSTPFLRGMVRRLREPVYTRCLAGFLFCTVDPWGTLTPCYDIRSGLNVRWQGLAALWRSAEFDALRQEVRRCSRRCWDVGSAEPSLLLDPFVLRGKLRGLVQAYRLIRRRD
jgi:MoaA/NifB/PqqE/SkfB family radical SAM enzyme